MIRLKKATVCAGIIFHEGKILIAKRAYGLSTKNLWEFPGGKIEKLETPEDCLLRECREELMTDIQITREYERTSYSYPDRDIDFIFFLCTVPEKEAVRQIRSIHSEIAWVSPAELADYPFCPADDGVIRKLAADFAK